jgi:hypothetical protein
VNPSLHQSRAHESVQVALSHLTFNQVIQGSIRAIIELTATSKITAFTKAKFCNTVMPDGQRIFKDC